MHSPYPLVDVLRALAALTVVLYHVIELGQWSSFPSTGAWLVFRIGWIGVDCFFVISGFVIALSAVREYQRQPIGYWRSFAIRRLTRIAPLYLLTCTLYLFLVHPQQLQQSWQALLANVLSHALFVHNLHPQTIYAMNGPSWSIGLEMQFYALVMLITPWLARVSIWRMVASLALFAWGYRYAITWFLPPGQADPQLQQIYTVQLPGTLDQFALGMAFGLAIARNEGRLAALLQPAWRNCLMWSALAVVLSVPAWMIFWRHPGYWNEIGMVVFWRTLLAAVFVCALGAVMTFPYARLRALRPLCYLGEISYGIYLWHMLVLLTLIELPQLRGTPLLAKTFVGTVVLASMSWHLFERPLLDKVKRRPGPGRSAC